MPVVMVGHLREGKPSLQRVRHVVMAADAGVLLQRLHDAEEATDVEQVVVEGHQDLGTAVANDGVTEIIEPMVLISVAAERVVGPVIE